MSTTAFITLVSAIGVAFFISILLACAWVRLNATHSPGLVSVQVLVLGDIGRSPRMQYHALSIAKHSGRVDLIGYHESPLHPDLVNNARVNLYPLPPPPAVLRSKSLPFIISGPLKVLWQVWGLYWTLAHRTPPARWLLVQNPPSIPTLFVAYLIAPLRNTQVIIDWHNYGWTILAGTKGYRHPFVKVYKVYECLFGRSASTVNITVTRAMAQELKEAPYSIRTPIITLHDRPASIFQPLQSSADRRKFLERLPETKDFASSIIAGETKLIVSSTSWTPDEDFSLLLGALVRYAQGTSRPIIAIITGKGPLKAQYQAQIQDLTKQGRLPNIRVFTAWLTVEDYAMLLRCADLGICLHMSSSGVDLPMKVVDMFGSGLPVAAYSDYKSFIELVKEGENGCGFRNENELAGILTRLFDDKGVDELRILREGARKEGRLRWDEEWDRVLRPVLGLIK